jgi:hypothetical protein
MEHLNIEALARLLDEPGAEPEREHLNRCRRCRDELDALRAQTLALSHLPDMRPPRGDWETLEARLWEEGLLRSGSVEGGRSARPLPAWWRAAAVVALLMGGTALGMGLSAVRGGDGAVAGGEPAGVRTAAGTSAGSLAALDPEAAAPDLTLDEAEDLVRLTESWYLTALVRYRDRLELEEGEPASSADPLTRYAALEALLAASQAAVQEAPTDPFLNGLLVNMRAEREATLRGIRATSAAASWY